MGEPYFEFGIWHATSNSLPLVARREPAALGIKSFGPQVLSKGGATESTAAHAFWITHDFPDSPKDIEVSIGGVPVTTVVNGHDVTTGRIPESIYARNGSYPIVLRQRNRTWFVGTLFVVD